MRWRCESKTRGHSWEQTDRTRSDVGPVAGSALAQIPPLMWATGPFLILQQSATMSPHTYPFINSPPQLKQKLWHIKDYLYLSKAAEALFFSLLK